MPMTCKVNATKYEINNGVRVSGYAAGLPFVATKINGEKMLCFYGNPTSIQREATREWLRKNV